MHGWCVCMICLCWTSSTLVHTRTNYRLMWVFLCLFCVLDFYFGQSDSLESIWPDNGPIHETPGQHALVTHNGIRIMVIQTREKRIESMKSIFMHLCENRLSNMYWITGRTHEWINETTTFEDQMGSHSYSETITCIQIELLCWQMVKHNIIQNTYVWKWRGTEWYSLFFFSHFFS